MVHLVAQTGAVDWRTMGRLNGVHLTHPPRANRDLRFSRVATRLRRRVKRISLRSIFRRARLFAQILHRLIAVDNLPLGDLNRFFERKAFFVERIDGSDDRASGPIASLVVFVGRDLGLISC